MEGRVQPAATYEKGDAVRENGSSFVSLKNENASHTPSKSPLWWDVLSEKGEVRWKGEFNPAAAYEQGDAARENGSSFVSLKNEIGGHRRTKARRGGDALAERGTQGAKGETGARGETGEHGHPGRKRRKRHPGRKRPHRASTAKPAPRKEGATAKTVSPAKEGKEGATGPKGETGAEGKAWRHWGDR